MLMKSDSTNIPETYSQVNSVMKQRNILTQASFATMKGGLGFQYNKLGTGVAL